MTNTDWYARKLGQAPQRRDDTPPVQQQVHIPQPPQQFTQQQPYPQQAYAQPAPNWDDMDQDQRRLYVLNNPTPGAGNKDAQTCPECGSGNLYSRRNGTGLINTTSYVAPQCFDCGWPLTQTGSIGGALGHG